MNENISVKVISKKFKIFKDNATLCIKTVKLQIFSDTKTFHACGWAKCTDDNMYNQSFGEALSEIRADLVLARMVETAMVKYTFDHLVDKESKSVIIADINKLLKKL